MAETQSGNSSNLHSSEATRFLVSDLCSQLEHYLEPQQVQDVYRAYLFGAEAHEGQMRQSGEPYIYHPLAVAKTMANMRMDSQSIVAAILHDVIEDTPTAKEHIADQFGADVAELVDGVSKLTHLTFESKERAKAENFRKMMLAMAQDIRVILVKLADRLHNMSTIDALRPDKRRRIARETLDIYAPIAQRLGMNTMRRDLEELGFKAMHPFRHRVIENAIKKAVGNRKEVMQQIEATIVSRLEDMNVEATIRGRRKNPYSLYKKMRDKHLSFDSVLDVYAIRIVCNDVDTCYRILGMAHNLYKPVPGRFKDYIAIPKANGYQSLHTVLFGPHGIPIEIQIRTVDMDLVAERGIAAHWLYKADGATSKAHTRAREWLKSVLEIQQTAGDSIEFLENLKVDLFPDDLYVFTPRGDIMELPRGATVVDFAYAVHTDVGNSCLAAKIDRKLAPLFTPLFNGQTVEIITGSGAKPNPQWLNFVKTAKARSNIRHYLKNLQLDEAESMGNKLLIRALANHHKTMRDLDNDALMQLATQLGMESAQELLQDIGLGNRMAPLVARQLLGQMDEGGIATDSPIDALEIKGSEGLVMSYAKCCYPIPGDTIVGILNPGRGIVVHQERCKNIADVRHKPDRCVPVQWAENTNQEFPVSIRVLSQNHRGVLASLAGQISEMESNIENLMFEERDSQTSTITFTLTTTGRNHLAMIMKRLRSIPEVIRINRSRG